MQQWSGSDLSPIKEFVQIVTLFIALAQQGSQIGIHVLEKNMLSVTKLKYKER